MGSKKEEERNEKIIRGLMKLPPNRRCMNCNSMGPQYVCTNFWSFVCMTCSGIHREFTHRVKSVSMAKFTSQEVEALQNGGNQRARDIYLKDWDLQRQRFPDSSNVDKIRQFIKDVYVDKKYAGGKTSEKPPRDTQNRGIREDDTRRASSYHSYSQSPPYDYQYEDRRYGKQAASLTRKPGSDRGRYEGKMSGFVYSPGRHSDQTYDDRFANEGSVSRASDYSASSGGDPFRSGAQSPNFQKNEGFSSPPLHLSRDGSTEEVRHHSVDSFPQRSRSAGSFGSFDGNFISHNSFNSSSEQGAETQDRLPFPGAAVPGSSDSLDFFEAQAVPAKSSSAAPIDLFQLPEAPPAVPVDLFQSSVMPTSAFQPSQASLTSLDLFSVTDQPATTTTSKEKLTDISAPRNEGWATFDIPQFSTPTTSNEKLTPAVIPSDSGGETSRKSDLFSLDTSMQWPSSQDSSFSGPSNMSSVWGDKSQGVTVNSTNTQFWNAFEDTLGYQHLGSIKQDSGLLVGSDGITSIANQVVGLTSSENAGLDGFHWAASNAAPLGPASSSLVTGTEYSQPVLPFVGEMEPPTDRKSNNPFDLPFDSEVGENNVFLDMASLQAALPNPQLSSDFLGDVSQPWFPQNSASPYIPSAGQGGVTYLAPQVPNAQIQNVSTQGPVATIGGNPFA